MKKQITFLTMTFLLALTSCNSVPEIPADATYTQLIQMGQDSLEIPNYRAAEAYYTAAIQRFGMNSTVYVEATYELGHLYLKQKKYSEAVAKFIELKELYRDAEYGVLPSSYSKLAQIGLDRIPDKYKPDPEKSGN